MIAVISLNPSLRICQNWDLDRHPGATSGRVRNKQVFILRHSNKLSALYFHSHHSVGENNRTGIPCVSVLGVQADFQQKDWNAIQLSGSADRNCVSGANVSVALQDEL